MLIKGNKAMSVFVIVLFIITQCFTAMAADDGPEVINSVVVEIEDDLVLFDIGLYGTAMAAGEGDSLYDYMTDGLSPNIRAVVSNDGKYISIGSYGEAFAEFGTVQGAVTEAEPEDEDIVKTYKVFEGFDEAGEPILAYLFPHSYSLTLEADPPEGGTVTDITGSGLYEAGALVNVTALANTGYGFVNWTVDEDVISIDDTFNYEMPAKDVTLVANFTKTLFDVTFTVKDSDGNDIDDATITLDDQVNPSGNYVYGGISAGEYSYTVTAEGFDTVDGTVSVIDEDVTENVVMTATVVAVTVGDVYRDGVSADIDGNTYYGIRELVGGVYNVELDSSKIEAQIGDIANCRIHIEIDGKTVLGQDDNGNIIGAFLIRDQFVLLPAVQQGYQDGDITINPQNLARAVVVLTEAELGSATVSELSRDSTSVGYDEVFYNGIREVVSGSVYNVELDMDKVQDSFGDISGCIMQLRIDGKVVIGEDSSENKIYSFIIKDGEGEEGEGGRYAILPAVQQGNQTEGITINPRTLGEAMVFLVNE
ncbi:MAG: InlB B-repeat-containing protein [Clostridia bacterium]|jgi:hypothetical protein